MKFAFEVYEHTHKTVEIEAENYDEAAEKMCNMFYDVDMSDAELCWDDREYEEVSAE